MLSLLRTGLRPLPRPAATAARWAPAAASVWRVAPSRPFSLNVYKEGEEPKIMADEEYPEWLKKLAYPPMTLEELEKMDVWEMDDSQRKRYWKLYKKQKLKKQNELARVSSV
jgi:hypothetical protein